MTRRTLVLSVSLLCAVILIGLGVWVARNRTPQMPTTSSTALGAPPVPVEQLHGYWLGKVKGILAAYDQDQNATKARDALAGLRVASEDRDVHLALVLAFETKVQGQAGADEKIVSARKKMAGL